MSYIDPAKQKAAQQRYYLEKKSKMIEAQRERRDKVRLYILEYKSDKECADCKIPYPHYILHFDHLRDKTAAISQMARDCNLEKIKEEIEKCELVCANCHAHRTYMRSRNNPRGSTY